jgi:hypothetical protein
MFQVYAQIDALVVRMCVSLCEKNESDNTNIYALVSLEVMDFRL